MESAWRQDGEKLVIHDKNNRKPMNRSLFIFIRLKSPQLMKISSQQIENKSLIFMSNIILYFIIFYPCLSLSDSAREWRPLCVRVFVWKAIQLSQRQRVPIERKISAIFDVDVFTNDSYPKLPLRDSFYYLLETFKDFRSLGFFS